MNIRLFIAGLLLVMLSGFLAGLDVPSTAGYVTDNAGLLSGESVRSLNNYLGEVDRSSGIQIAVLTIPSLEGDVLESFSINVVDSWGIGSAETDRGALLLVVSDERKIRIEVGYGLEGVLTDVVSGAIIRNVIVPSFRQGGFDEGIRAGVEAMVSIASDGTEAVPAVSTAVSNPSAGRRPEGVQIFFMLFLIFFVFARISTYGRYRRRGMSPLGALFLGSMLGRSMRRGGGFGGFGGGSSGGGFGGFGGGGFGGGGASGGW